MMSAPPSIRCVRYFPFDPELKSKFAVTIRGFPDEPPPLGLVGSVAGSKVEHVEFRAHHRPVLG
jgi:hypothetical protein